MSTKILNSKSYILIIILIIATFFRLYNITDLPPGLYPDEAMNGNNALESFKIFYPENNGREGLFINIQAVFLKVLMALFNSTPEPWMLRLPSALFGILTVLGIYFLGKELFNKKIALLSSFFLATSFWHINFSRIGFRAIMASFFLIWAIYFLIKSLNSKSYILNSIIAGLFFGLGFYSYIAYRIMPILIAIIFFYWLFKNKEPQVRKKILLSAFYFLLFAFIVALPIGIYFLQNPADFFGRTVQVSVSVSQSPIGDLFSNIGKTLAMFNFSGDWNWRHNIAGAPQLFWPVGILFVVGIILGIFSLFKKNESEFQVSSFKFQILFYWFALAILPTVVSNEGIPHALRAILMIPPIMIFAGTGGIWLYESIKYKVSSIKFGNKALLTISYLLLIICMGQAYYAYFIQWGKNQNVQGAFAADYVEIGKQLNALPKEMPKYVLVEAGGVNVRGIPMPTQTVMFITDTFTPEKQIAKNIFYILPDNFNQVPENAYTVIIK